MFNPTPQLYPEAYNKINLNASNNVTLRETQGGSVRITTYEKNSDNLPVTLVTRFDGFV